MLNVGVLAFQGSVEEHIRSLGRIQGVKTHEIRSQKDLENISGIILPGGESTTIGKLLKDYKMEEPIKKRVGEGMPIWGTCAGMILMAKKIVNEDYIHLGLMDISVKRNAYGSQLDSFRTSTLIPEVSQCEIPLVFIRAPWVEGVGKDVRILSTAGGRIIAAQQANMLATAFHPELTESIAFHEYFVDMAKVYSERNAA